jgi:predicted RNA-binding protein
MEDLMFLLTQEQELERFDILLSLFSDDPAIYGYIDLGRDELIDILNSNQVFNNEITKLVFNSKSNELELSGKFLSDQHSYQIERERIWLDVIGVGIIDNVPIVFEEKMKPRVKLYRDEDIKEFLGFYICSPGNLIQKYNKSNY